MEKEKRLVGIEGYIYYSGVRYDSNVLLKFPGKHVWVKPPNPAPFVECYDDNGMLICQAEIERAEKKSPVHAEKSSSHVRFIVGDYEIYRYDGKAFRVPEELKDAFAAAQNMERIGFDIFQFRGVFYQRVQVRVSSRSEAMKNGSAMKVVKFEVLPDWMAIGKVWFEGKDSPCLTYYRSALERDPKPGEYLWVAPPEIFGFCDELDQSKQEKNGWDGDLETPGELPI